MVVVLATVLAGAVWLTTLLGARGVLGVNRVVGIRTPATRRSDVAWRAGHRAALPVVTGSALVALVGGALTLATTGGSPARGDEAGLALIGLVAVLTAVAGVVAHRAARASQTGGTQPRR